MKSQNTVLQLEKEMSKEKELIRTSVTIDEESSKLYCGLSEKEDGKRSLSRGIRIGAELLRKMGINIKGEDGKPRQ